MATVSGAGMAPLMPRRVRWMGLRNLAAPASSPSVVAGSRRNADHHRRSMFETITSPAQLHAAWRRVRRNGAAPGGDGETREQFADNLDARLDQLRAELRGGRYRPGHLRSVPLERPDGRIRRLRIPGLADRVAQTAAQTVLAARLDRHMHRDSFGYRPGRSVDQALARLRRRAQGQRYVLDADIRAFFDRVPHDRLRDELGIWIPDRRVTALLGLWIVSFGGRRGLAQGAPIAPLMANIFLHPLDAAFAREGVPHIRYADDFVALAPDRAGVHVARRVAAGVLARRGLDLHPDKTAIRRLDHGLTFLGEHLAFD